jgi:AcrR family transcriptional regulator
MQNAHADPGGKGAADPNRGRLIEGLAAAIAEKGYAAATIADIVAHARVSKRTFYEHFSDKETCFLVSYQVASDRALAAVASAVDPDRPSLEQIDVAARAYMGVLEENPALTRAFLLEIHAAGPRAMKLRRQILEQFAAMLRNLVQVGRKQHPELRPLSPAMSTALVGGINELVLVALEKGRAGSLRELAGTAAELVRAVLLAPGDQRIGREDHE